ncbi:UNVERIFIED_CONTAM: hypothetical protein FKN15_071206 [Acipenser sinensis]
MLRFTPTCTSSCMKENTWAVGSPLVMDPNSICRKMKRLAGKQAELCQTEPEIVSEVVKGAKLGVRECQFQFRFRKWNCTSHNKYFGKVLQQGSYKFKDIAKPFLCYHCYNLAFERCML